MRCSKCGQPTCRWEVIMSDMEQEQIRKSFKRQVKLCSGIGRLEMLNIIDRSWRGGVFIGDLPDSDGQDRHDLVRFVAAKVSMIDSMMKQGIRPTKEQFENVIATINNFHYELLKMKIDEAYADDLSNVFMSRVTRWAIESSEWFQNFIGKFGE